MVKNSTGGNKSKKQARGTSYNPQQNVRKAKEEGEIYAVVSKIYGGPNCLVMCNDGVARNCIIRNKFKTRGKRENNISVGSWILVGIREWEVRTDGTQKCDLLEVYSHAEKDKLKQIEVCDFKYLNEVNSYKEPESEQMQFSTAANNYDDDEVEDPASMSTASMSMSTASTSMSTASSSSSSDDEDEDVVIKQQTLKELMSTKNTEIKIPLAKQNDWLCIDDI